MIKVKGKHNSAKIFSNKPDGKAISQITELCNQKFTEGSRIRIMPDYHSGAGCVIGTTMTIIDKVVPNIVGVDIGCGVSVAKLREKDINLHRLDETIRLNIPSGFNTRTEEHDVVKSLNFNKLKCMKKIDINRAKKSIGTLGGGNHFIELNRSNDGDLYLVIHSGSRYLGKQIAEFYQDKAYKELVDTSEDRENIIRKLKSEGREKDIQTELNKLKQHKVKKELAYVKDYFWDYLNDMNFAVNYALLNRLAMTLDIVKLMDLKIVEYFNTIHNYIDTNNMIVRKGAISAQKNEKVIIPINSRDGSIIAIGKGNLDWNFSAPHGAGRLMSRREAKDTISVDEYRKSMDGIFSKSINESTVDEAPMVYKPMEEILENISDTVDVVKVIEPVYNFKA